VVNSNPQIISLPVTGINEDKLYTYLVEAVDWDGDRINIHLEEAPIWLTLNLETWILSGVPVEKDVGIDTVVLQVSDSLGGINRQVFFLTVYAVNDPPKIIQEIPVLQFQEDDSLEYKIADLYQYVEDPDDAHTSLNYNIKHGRYVSTAPKDSTISLQAPINWCGRDTLKLIVSDGEFSDSTDVHVVVTPVNDAPYFVNWPDTVQFSNTSPHVIIMGEYVQDPDLPYDQLNWQFAVSDEILIYQFYPKTTALILGAPEFEGIVKLYCRIIDDGSASIIDSFYVKIVDEMTSTADLTNDIPKEYGLEQNYPNPFNSSTTISYAIPENGEVILEIYNSLGQKIATLLSAYLTAGYYQFAFNVQNLPSGIYFYHMQVGPFQDIKKMLVVK
jgi:hypothetical protein